MDNWDYKFQHPVIVGRQQSQLKHISGIAQATAVTPDTIKSSTDLGNTSFVAAGETIDVYSDVSKVVLKLATPHRVTVGVPYLVNLSIFPGINGEIYYSPAAYLIRGHAITLRLQEIVAPFDLDVDTSWNGLSGLTLGSNVDTVQARVDSDIGQLISHQILYLPTKMSVPRTPVSQVTVYGFVVSAEMGCVGAPGTVSSFDTELIFTRPETVYQFLTQPSEL